MVAAFSSPILSVAADAVRDLEGHDALFGLWTGAYLLYPCVSDAYYFLVFTKCKTSLPNGARLENITWRLWHCELKGPVLPSSSRITKESDAVEAISPLEKSPYQPPSPSESTMVFPTHTSPADPTQYSSVLEGMSISHGSFPALCIVICILEFSGIPLTIPQSFRSSSSNYVIASRCCLFLPRSTSFSDLFPFVPTREYHSSGVQQQA